MVISGKIKILFLSIFFIILSKVSTAQTEIPYYFVAIHNEPHHETKNGSVEDSFLILKEMIRTANDVNIKLTLMFTPQWVELFLSTDDNLNRLKQWQNQGHEIGAHHHSVEHTNWDGYTDFPMEKVLEQRIKQRTPMGMKPESHLGSMADFMQTLKAINPQMQSACLNDEKNKTLFPDEIIYDTCSGFRNFGTPGILLSDAANPKKGQNEYVTLATINGIKRTWLTHYMITRYKYQLKAQQAFLSMNKGVYGVVTHSDEKELGAYLLYLEFLSLHDPGGSKSMTVSEIIESNLLPEVWISF